MSRHVASRYLRRVILATVFLFAPAAPGWSQSAQPPPPPKPVDEQQPARPRPQRRTPPRPPKQADPTETQTVWPGRHSAVTNFIGADRAYDSPRGMGTFAYTANLERLCNRHCNSPSTASATFDQFKGGLRPLRLEVKWTASTGMLLHGGTRGKVVAKLEYDLGRGWKVWERHEWSRTSPVCGFKDTSIVCNYHLSTYDLPPKQRSGAIRVRVSVTSQMPKCETCSAFGTANLAAVGRIYDVRLIVAAVPPKEGPKPNVSD